MNNHCNIWLKNAHEREALMDDIIAGKENFTGYDAEKTAFINTQSILAYIEEELNHDKSDILNFCGQTLVSMSSGERKKAFFDYIIRQNYSRLVLDCFFDNLDSTVSEHVKSVLEQLKDTCHIVNIFTRKSDALAFINADFVYLNRQLIPALDESEDAGYQVDEIQSENTPLPPSDRKNELPEGVLISFKNVSVSYQDHPVLHNINWEIKAGEFWHLCGPNGSGKSTLLSLITGDNPKAYGQNITIFGCKKGSGESIWDIKRKIGYFTSNMTFRFWRFQSIRNMILSGFYDSIGLYAIPGDYQVQLANQWLDFLGLRAEADVPFVKMSACHQRLVMIARSMVKHPPVLILDEPTADLDEAGAHRVVQIISRIAAQTNTAIIFVSHRYEPGLCEGNTFRLVSSPRGSYGMQD